MKSYRVFLGAPPASEIKIRRDEYHWQTVSEPAATPISQHHVDITLPVTIVEAASKRISALYENIIFREDDDESHYLSVLGLVPSVRPGLDPLDDATAITWLPTVQDVTNTHEASRLAFTFLRPSASVANIHPAEETQGTGSYDHSDASSVGIFPDFHFSIHDLTSLSHLAAQAQSDVHKPGAEGSKTSQKVTLLAAVLEVDGPDTIHIKQGAEAGKEVSLLKLILGDEEGAVSKLTAWREVAESWGGSDPAETETTRVKRGDIVLLESVLASWGGGIPSDVKETKATSPVTLTASSNIKSRMEICYRTMPLMPDDGQFRPDLRLGFSDASVRKVTSLVEWFETMAGLVNADSDTQSS